MLFCGAQAHREAKPQGQGSCAICFTGLATPQQGHLHAYDCKKILRQNQLHIAKISSRLLKTQISGKPTALPPQNTTKHIRNSNNSLNRKRQWTTAWQCTAKHCCVCKETSSKFLRKLSRCFQLEFQRRYRGHGDRYDPFAECRIQGSI